MDQTTQNGRGLNQHIQSNTNGSSYNSFINGLQSYADTNNGTESSDFDFSWNSNLFNNTNNDQTSTFLPQHAGAPSGFGNDESRQTNSPALPQYNGVQQSFTPGVYNSHSLDPRQMSQSANDPRFYQHPSPSPNPYSQFSLAPNMNYGRSERPTHSPQPFIAQQPLQPRKEARSTPPYPNQPYHNPYYNYGNQNLSWQDNDILSMHDYSELFSQPSNITINPSQLNNSTVLPQRDAQGRPQQPQLPQRQMNSSPYFTTPSLPMQRVHQSIQPQMVHQQQHPPGSAAMTGVFPAQPNKTLLKPKVPRDPNAPKRPRGRPRKDGTITGARREGQDSVSASDCDSEDELVIDDEPPDPRPAILVVAPPTDVAGRAMYDAVAAVWSPKNKPPVWDNVAKGLALFADAIKALRDAWKVRNEAYKKAEAANSSATEDLRKDVARFRQNMETTMQRALQYGHDAHLSRLGENLHTLIALHSFLLDRVNATDYDGSLVLSILRLVVKFTTMTEEALEKTKLLKVVQRLAKKGGAECRALAQAVLDNAAAATRKKAETSQSPVSPKASMETAKLPRSDLLVGLKRPREADGLSQPATKRVVTKPIPQASKPLAVQAAERRRAEAAAQAKAAKEGKQGTNGVTAPTPAAASTVAKTKVPVTVPKPTNNLFSSLKSASKKPGTSNAEKAASAPKKESPPPTGRVSAQPSFSFMDTLADMSKPKEVEQKKVEEPLAETEEERQRRLRKEDRRKLHVSWKPEDSLVETRLFVHDPDEEVGHADSMMRDVDDIGGEGRMLKLHMDKEGLEDEDEEGEDLGTYLMPSEVDLSEVPDREHSYLKTGGDLTADSPASQAQELHEQNSLMVVYALPTDLPPSPKEPSATSEEDDYQPEASFGEPTEATRKREAEVITLRPLAQNQASNPSINLSAIIAAMRQPQQPVQQQQPAPSANVFGALNQQPSMATQGSIDIQSILAAANLAGQIQGQQPPRQQYPAQPASAPAPNLAALLAQMGQGQQPQGLAMGTEGNPNPYPGNENDYSRKHGRNDFGNIDDTEDDMQKKKKRFGSRDGTKPYLYKTEVCSFWLKGQCIKGDNCTYIHDGAD